MRPSLNARPLYATVFLLTVVAGAQQPPTTQRCVVTVGTAPGANIIFKVQADSVNLPEPQGIWVHSPGQSGLAFRFAYYQTSENHPDFLVAAPSSGLTSGWVWVGLDPKVVPYMPPGTYTLTPRFSLVDERDKVCDNLVRPIILVVLDIPPPQVTTVLNAVTQEIDFSPGTVISIYGKRLATPPIEAHSDGAGLYPTSLGNTTVFMNDVPAPILYVSQDRIDTVIPHSLAGQTDVFVTVKHNRAQSDVYRITVRPTAPAIFTAAGHGGGLPILNPNGTPNSGQNPASPGSEIRMRATGVGLWNHTLPDGSIALSSVFFPHYLQPVNEEVILRPQAPVSLTIGGQPAEIRTATPALGELFGTLHLTALIPQNLAPGLHPAVLTIGDNSNLQQQVMVAVK